MSDSEEFRRQTDKDIATLAARADQSEKRDESIATWMRTISEDLKAVRADMAKGSTEFATNALRIKGLESDIEGLKELPARVETLEKQSKSLIEWLKMPVTGVLSALGGILAAKFFGGGGSH